VQESGPLRQAVTSAGEPATPTAEARVGHPTFSEALWVWTKVGLNSFGGPAGQIAVMHRMLVEERRWVSESRFLHALNYCMLLPGPEAQQLAVYIGWLLHRTLGGLAAGVLFVLPGALTMLLLSVLYASAQDVTVVEALFFGLKPAILAVVIEAVFRIGRRAFHNRALVGLAAAAFIAIFFFRVPFPAVVLAAAAIGLVGTRIAPWVFLRPTKPTPEGDAVGDTILEAETSAHLAPSLPRALRVTAACLALWFVPVVLLGVTLGKDHVFVQEGFFFSKTAVVSFGGAYAVLAYMAQRAVETYRWLAPGEMLDGLAMAETTPGPLIMVVQFVGFMGAYRDPGALPPLLAGVVGAAITTWVTFVPCFLWIFLGAPYIERLRGKPALNGALTAITASVVGVILNLSVWFGLHTLFNVVERVDVGPLSLLRPVWSTANPPSFLLAVAAAVALVRFRVGMIPTLLGCALLGLVYRLMT